MFDKETQIGKLIKDTRKKKKISQQKLADDLCVSNKTISKWETGEGFPDIVILDSLAKMLKISVEQLLKGNENIEIEKGFYRRIRESFILKIFSCLIIISLSVFVGVIICFVIDSPFLGLPLIIISTIVAVWKITKAQKTFSNKANNFSKHKKTICVCHIITIIITMLYIIFYSELCIISHEYESTNLSFNYLLGCATITNIPLFLIFSIVLSAMYHQIFLKTKVSHAKRYLMPSVGFLYIALVITSISLSEGFFITHRIIQGFIFRSVCFSGLLILGFYSYLVWRRLFTMPTSKKRTILFLFTTIGGLLLACLAIFGNYYFVYI